MKEDGKDFKPIFGVEAYFVPSVEEWKEAYEKEMERVKKEKEEKQELFYAISKNLEDEKE